MICEKSITLAYTAKQEQKEILDKYHKRYFKCRARFIKSKGQFQGQTQEA
jgi:hypothetical protein